MSAPDIEDAQNRIAMLRDAVGDLLNTNLAQGSDIAELYRRTDILADRMAQLQRPTLRQRLAAWFRESASVGVTSLRRLIRVHLTREARCPAEFAEVVERGKAWLAVYEPCGTEGCDSPTCQLAYAMRRAIAAEVSVKGGDDDSCDY